MTPRHAWIAASAFALLCASGRPSEAVIVQGVGGGGGGDTSNYSGCNCVPLDSGNLAEVRKCCPNWFKSPAPTSSGGSGTTSGKGGASSPAPPSPSGTGTPTRVPPQGPPVPNPTPAPNPGPGVPPLPKSGGLDGGTGTSLPPPPASSQLGGVLIPDPLQNGIRDAGGVAGAAVAAAPSVAGMAAPSAEDLLDRVVAPLDGASPAAPGRRAEDLLRDAAGLYGMRAWSEAAREALQAEALDPGNADAALLASRAYERLKRYGDAEAQALDAARLRKDAAALEALARARWGRGMLREALEAAREAVRLAPDDAEAWALLGALLDATGDHQGALDAFRRAAQLDARYETLLRRALAGERIRAEDLDDLGLDELRRTSRPWAAGAAAAGLILLTVLGTAAWRRHRPAPLAVFADVVERRPPTFAEKYDDVRLASAEGPIERLEARDRGLDRQVTVVRVQPSSAAERESLLAAARQAAASPHPAPVPFYEVLEEGGKVLLVFGSAEGRADVAGLLASLRQS